jgi:hypothetical protein
MEILATIVGWILGLATTPAVRYFERRSKRESLRGALRAELADTREQGVATAMYIWMKRGKTGRTQLEWEVRLLEREPQSDFARRNVPLLQEQLKMTDAQMAALAAHTAAEQSGISAQRFELPFLAGHISDLSVFSASVQERLLHIVKECRFFNAIVEEAREYKALTFKPDIGSDNFAIAAANLRRSEERLADRAQIIAEAADELLSVADWN